MKTIQIEYDKEMCIGARKCVEVAPSFFSFDGVKAILKGAEEVGSVEVLTVKASPKQVETFKKAAEMCPVNAIKVVDLDKETVLVSNKVTMDKVKEIQAKYDDLKEFVMDKTGYFLIRIDQEKKIIEVAFCPELNKITVKITGRKPLEIYQTIIKQGLVSRLDHAAYLGRELQKAYIALQKGIPYVQDDELKL